MIKHTLRLIVVALIISSCKYKTEKGDQGALITAYLEDSNRAKVGNTFFSLDTIYYPNGSIKYIRSLKDTLQHGYFFEFYSKGSIGKICFFWNGRQHGIQRYYYEDGSLNVIGNYKNGIQDSIQKIFYGNGRVKLLYRSKQYKKAGSECAYYQTGKLKQYNFYNELGELKYQRAYDTIGKLLSEKGNAIIEYGLNNHTSVNYKVGEDCSIHFEYATPPKCNLILKVIETTSGLYPEVIVPALTRKDDVGFDCSFILRKEGEYNFRIAYTISDSLTINKSEFERNINIHVSK